MESFIFLGCLALASAAPFTNWGNVGSLTSEGIQTSHGGIADKIARDITQGAIRDQVANTHEAIKSLQRQLWQHPQSGYSQGIYGGVENTPFHSGVHPTGLFGVAHHVAQHSGPAPGVRAIQHLEVDAEHQKHQFSDVGRFGEYQEDVAQELFDTVKSGVEAQLVVAKVRDQEAARGLNVPTVSDLQSGVFQAKLRKLMDEQNVQGIENQITHHHHLAQQLHHQQLFVNQQRQQIEVQKAIVQQQGEFDMVHQLEQVHDHLRWQEYHLIKEQLAHHLAILQLRKALVQKEEQVLKDTVAEHVHEQNEHGSFDPSWQGSWSL